MRKPIADRLTRIAISMAALAALTSSAGRALADDADECATRAENAMDAKEARPADAIALFEQCARDTCPRVVREDCRAALAELRASAPRISVRVRDDRGLDVADVTVTLDGVSLSTEERAQGVFVNPGPREIVVTHPSGRRSTKRFVVVAGDKSRVVDVELSSGPAVAVSPVRRPSTELTIERVRTPAIVVGSVGLASLVAFAVLGGWTYADYRRLEDSCGPGCSKDEVDPVRARALAADVTLAVGATSLVVATILWFTAPEKRVPRKAALSW